jgi:adenylylsulfate kinase-like enzyme
MAADRIAALGLMLAPAAPSRHVAGTGAVIWLTGLPGGGKTTLAVRLTDSLSTHGMPATILEWAALRATVLVDACPSMAALELAHRALACAAAELAAAGLVVVVDAAAPRRAWRELGRALVGSFAEVQLLCPPEICADRERAVRWRPSTDFHATCAQAPEWTVAYEYAATPDLIIDTAIRNEWTATEDLVILARRLLAATAPDRSPPCKSATS